MVGTAHNGARSDTVDCVRCSDGLPSGLSWSRGGEDERIPVVEVGIGVGYLVKSCRSGDLSLIRLTCRGRLGEDEAGSKAGSRAGLFVPASGGKLVRVFILLGDESIMALDIQKSSV